MVVVGMAVVAWMVLPFGTSESLNGRISWKTGHEMLHVVVGERFCSENQGDWGGFVRCPVREGEGSVF